MGREGERVRHVERWLLGAGASGLAWLLARLGGWDAAMQAMFLLMGLDLLTGTLCALLGKCVEGERFCSRRMFEGLSRKVMMLALVMLATALDDMLGTQGVSRAAVVGFYCANEGMSIVENAALLGVPFPQAVLTALEAMRNKENSSQNPTGAAGKGVKG